MTDEINLLVPDDEELTDNGKIFIKLHRVIIKRERWQFNLNDPDPFPSTPHGHNVEGEKLNLSDGTVYDKMKRAVRVLSNKKIKYIKNYLSGTHHK